MHASEIAKLINGYLNHTLSTAEEAQLQDWVLADPSRRQLLDELRDGQKQREALQLIDRFTSSEALERILSKAQHPEEPAPRMAWNRYWIKIAAIFLLAVASGLYIYQKINPVSGYTETSVPKVSPPVLQSSGSNRATLTLTNGNTVALDSAQNKIIVANGEIRYNNGKLLADVTLSERMGAAKSIQASLPALPLCLTTPKGGNYQVILPDGTKVWLNTASKLKYLSKFPAGQREVELEGEAYFQVSEQKAPFLVKTRGQSICVLGTAFNVSAYAEDEVERTTLISGKVRVEPRRIPADTQISDEAVLSPGQQAIQRSGFIKVKQADIEVETAWRSGYFMFDQSLGRVMRILARWYALDIQVSPELERRTVAGKFSRSRDFRQIFDYLSKLADFEYSLNGNRVVLTKK